MLDFLAYASTRRPQQTLDMLLQRIAVSERERKPGDRRVTPFPQADRSFTLPGLAAAGNETYLRQIRDATNLDGGISNYWISRLFGVCSGSMPAALTTLREWGTSNDRQKVEAAAFLCRGFEHDFVFDQHAFIANILKTANALGSECSKAVMSDLWAVSIGGVRSGGLGTPSPRLVSDKHRAEELIARYNDESEVIEFYKIIAKYADDSMKRDQDDYEEMDL
jgi:hypothetical protein